MRRTSDAATRATPLPNGSGVSATAHFPPRRIAVREARHWLRRHLADADGVDELSRDVAELLLSELAANAVVHAHSKFEVHLVLRGDCLRLEVADADDDIPAPLQIPPDSTAGRGLAIVEALADRVGADRRRPGGKAMWFEIDLPARPALRHDDHS